MFEKRKGFKIAFHYMTIDSILLLRHLDSTHHSLPHIHVSRYTDMCVSGEIYVEAGLLFQIPVSLPIIYDLSIERERERGRET